MAPCVNCRIVSGRPVPKPTWVSPSPAPRDCVTRSRKYTTFVLNPGVFRFARLFPTTSTAVAVALRAESAVEKEVNIDFSCRLCGRDLGLDQTVQVAAHPGDILAHIHGLLQLLELSQ